MNSFSAINFTLADPRINTSLLDFWLNREVLERFLQLFKSDNNLPPGREFKILDQLFADVDAYCSDPDLMEDPRFDIDGVQLQVSARETLDKLLKLTAVLTSEK